MARQMFKIAAALAHAQMWSTLITLLAVPILSNVLFKNFPKYVSLQYNLKIIIFMPVKLNGLNFSKNLKSKPSVQSKKSRPEQLNDISYNRVMIVSCTP